MKMKARIVRMRDIHLDESLFRNYLAGYKELCGCLSIGHPHSDLIFLLVNQRILSVFPSWKKNISPLTFSSQKAASDFRSSFESFGSDTLNTKRVGK